MSLPTPNIADERRQYFRIKHSLFMHYKTIGKNQGRNHEHKEQSFEPLLEPPSEQTAGDSLPFLYLLRELNQIEQQNKAFINTLKTSQTTVSSYIDSQNTKIAQLSQYLVDNLDHQYNDLSEVDLSGGGIRFTAETELEQGQELKLEILLIPEYRNMVIYGSLIECKKIEDEEGFEYAITFNQIKESDRDAIIKHVFKIQSEQLRSQQKKPDQG